MNSFALRVSLAVAAVLALSAFAFYLIVSSGPADTYADITDDTAGAAVPVRGRDDRFLCERSLTARIEKNATCASASGSETCAAQLTGLLHDEGKLARDLKVRVMSLETTLAEVKNGVRPIWRVTANAARATTRGASGKNAIRYDYEPCRGRFVERQVS